MSFTKRIDEWVLPQTLKSGCFGKDAELVSWQNDESRKGEDQFSSTVQFIHIKVRKNGKIETVKAVLKLQGENQFIWDVTNYKEQFQNELLMYSEVFPTLNRDGIIEEIYCKFYHGIVKTGAPLNQDFLLLEDLSPRGYRLYDETFLDYDHLVIALKAIGRFHGLSYVAKKQKPDEFNALVAKIQDKWCYDYMMKWKEIYHKSSARGILPVIKKGKSVELLTQLQKNFEDVGKLYYSTVEPIEPESVICHGDFNRNNMLFSYDSNGKVESVKLFDLQTPIYSSPVMDLSFFFFMNTNKETRDKHWDDLLNVYKAAVASVCPGINLPELSFKRCAVYGYLICCYFLPFMLNQDAVDENALRHLNSEQQAVLFAKYGGEKGTQAITDVVEFLVEKDFLQHTYY